MNGVHHAYNDVQRPYTNKDGADQEGYEVHVDTVVQILQRSKVHV